MISHCIGQHQLALASLASKEGARAPHETGFSYLCFGCSEEGITAHDYSMHCWGREGQSNTKLQWPRPSFADRICPKQRHARTEPNLRPKPAAKQLSGRPRLEPLNGRTPKD